MVEQRTHKPLVGGSNPPPATPRSAGLLRPQRRGTEWIDLKGKEVLFEPFGKFEIKFRCGRQKTAYIPAPPFLHRILRNGGFVLEKRF